MAVSQRLNKSPGKAPTNVLILDSGSYSIKAGLGGCSLPHCVVPTIEVLRSVDPDDNGGPEVRKDHMSEILQGERNNSDIEVTGSEEQREELFSSGQTVKDTHRAQKSINVELWDRTSRQRKCNFLYGDAAVSAHSENAYRTSKLRIVETGTNDLFTRVPSPIPTASKVNTEAEHLVISPRSRREALGSNLPKSKDKVDPKSLQSNKVKTVFPLNDGKIIDRIALESLWDYTVTEEMGLAWSGIKQVVLVVPPDTTSVDEMWILDVFFNKFQVASVALISTPTASLFSCGSCTGISLDMGYQRCSATPIFQSHILASAAVSTPIGGGDLTQYLQFILATDPSFLGEDRMKFASSFYLVNRMKHAMVSVSTYDQKYKHPPLAGYRLPDSSPRDPADEERDRAKDGPAFELPDGSVIVLSDERLKYVPGEILFNLDQKFHEEIVKVRHGEALHWEVRPRGLENATNKPLGIQSNSPGGNSPCADRNMRAKGMKDNKQKNLNSTPAEVELLLANKRTELIVPLPVLLAECMLRTLVTSDDTTICRTIILSGGGSLIPGMASRLIQETRAELCKVKTELDACPNSEKTLGKNQGLNSDLKAKLSEVANSFNITDTTTRHYAGWIGASILSTLPTFELFCINRNEYLNTPAQKRPEIIYNKKA